MRRRILAGRPAISAIVAQMGQIEDVAIAERAAAFGSAEGLAKSVAVIADRANGQHAPRFSQ
jgi:hypothetical protein